MIREWNQINAKNDPTYFVQRVNSNIVGLVSDQSDSGNPPAMDAVETTQRSNGRRFVSAGQFHDGSRIDGDPQDAIISRGFS